MPFVLVPDPKRTIIDAYGVAWPIIKMAKRVTFLIDTNFRIASFSQHELLIGRHAEDVLLGLKMMQRRE